MDDAVILEPGHCQLESWRDRQAGGTRTLLHAGAGCRVGPVEVGLNLDRTVTAASGSSLVAGPQLKWATALSDTFSTGVIVSIRGQKEAPRFSGSSVTFPMTWQAGKDWLLHANFGRDFLHRAPSTPRAGIAVEWEPLQDGSFVAERIREGGADSWRLGARWNLSPSLSLDFSRARGIEPDAPRSWLLGLGWTFRR